MRIVYMGTPEFSAVSLQALLAAGHEIAAVVTVPDRQVGRGLKVRHSAVKQTTIATGIPVLQPANLADAQLVEQLLALRAELFVVVAFRILPPEIFEIPPLGTINLHSSLLPKYRGAAPINWAIINGETETGVSTIFIQQDVDAGDLILQERVDISPDETAGQLHDRLAEAGAALLVETVARIQRGQAPGRKQEGDVTKAPKLTRELGNIPWEKGSSEIRNLIRGLNPIPGAYTFYQNQQLKLFEAAIQGPIPAHVLPGTLLVVDTRRGELVVATGLGGLSILSLQPAGKRRMSTKDYLLGNALKEGDRFESS